MKINIFTPPKFKKKELDINYLNNITDKSWHYSVSGKASIYHILKDMDIDKILVPIYICDSVLSPLKILNIEPIFYDIEIEDLNPSLNFIKELNTKYNIKAVLIASMYGNPANLIEIENYCKENNIFMIDDAAQSFGAKLEDRYVGTFGDAGFFSFSTGKPTAGHMGSFFWSKESIEIQRTKHCFIHYLRWLDFYNNRYIIYEKKKSKLLKYGYILAQKFINLYNDEICEFEKEILGGILSANLNGDFDFRYYYFTKFIDNFSNNRYFKVIKSLIGNPNNHKFILLFNTKELAQKFIEYMQNHSIYVSNGYTLLSLDLSDLPNAKSIDKRVVELPIEDNKEKMKYLFEKVKKFEYKDSKK